MKFVTVTKLANGKYRISVGVFIWYENLNKAEVIDALEKTLADLKAGNTDYNVEFMF